MDLSLRYMIVRMNCVSESRLHLRLETILRLKTVLKALKPLWCGAMQGMPLVLANINRVLL